MNKEEFKELQEETALFLFRIARLNKDLFITDVKYSHHFQELLNEQFEIERELNCIRGMIENKSRNLNYEEFKKAFIKKMNEDLNTIRMRQHNKETIYEPVTSKTPEEEKEIDDYYRDFILKYHPIIHNCRIKEVLQAYEFVEKLYNENNYTGMIEAFNLNKHYFDYPTISVAAYNDVAMLYYDFKKNLTARYFNIKNDQYPKSKIEVVKTEKGIEEEKVRIKKEIEALLEVLSKARIDFKNLFGYEFSF